MLPRSNCHVIIIKFSCHHENVIIFFFIVVRYYNIIIPCKNLKNITALSSVLECLKLLTKMWLYGKIYITVLLQSQLLVSRRFVVSTLCSCRRFVTGDVLIFDVLKFDFLSFDVLYVHRNKRSWTSRGSNTVLTSVKKNNAQLFTFNKRRLTFFCFRQT
jgi:hypothetical protein